MAMKISVIVPTYKPQAYLWECLDSIAAQTFSKEDFEVLLVLNGCCEPYNSQIKDWLSNHDELQVRYIQTDVPGVSNARNVALDRATGEYVTFIDDDDYVSPDYLSGLYAVTSGDTMGLCYPYAFRDGNLSHQLPYALTKQYEQLAGKVTMTYPRARKYFSGPWMKLMPMSFIQGRRFDVRFKNGEDSLFMFLISDRFSKVSFASRDVVYYRRVRESSATTKHRDLCQRINNQLEMIREYNHIYYKRAKSYKVSFYFTRIVGAIKSIFV